MEKKKKKRERYEKPVLEKFDVVAQGAACSTGSSPAAACIDGNDPTND
jgi:hypothetical protein